MNLADLCRNNNFDIVENMLANGENPNSIDRFGISALSYTIRKRPELAFTFLECGVNPNLGICNPLFDVLNINNKIRINLLIQLLKNGANPNCTNTNGFTPFMEACVRDLYEEAILFLDFGANINHQSDDGDTGLHMASAGGYGNRKFIEILLKRGANPKLLTLDGNYQALDMELWN